MGQVQSRQMKSYKTHFLRPTSVETRSLLTTHTEGLISSDVCFTCIFVGGSLWIWRQVDVGVVRRRLCKEGAGLGESRDIQRCDIVTCFPSSHCLSCHSVGSRLKIIPQTKNCTMTKINGPDSLSGVKSDTLMFSLAWQPSRRGLIGGCYLAAAASSLSLKTHHMSVHDWKLLWSHELKWCYVSPQQVLKGNVQVFVKGKQGLFCVLCEQSQEKNTWIIQRWVSHNGRLEKEHTKHVKNTMSKKFVCSCHRTPN